MIDILTNLRDNFEIDDNVIYLKHNAKLLYKISN